MDVKEVKKRVKAIKEIAADYEAAHGMEDCLHQDVLKAIADGDNIIDVQELASEALKTQKIKFSRYTA